LKNSIKLRKEKNMKKKPLLVSTVGIAAGLAYALESNRRRRASEKYESRSEGSSTNERSATASGADGKDSAEQSERGASMARIKNGKATLLEEESLDHEIDDHGTNQATAANILGEIRDNAFDASSEKLALALGRPTEEIEEWISGKGLIDADVVMKARALAIQRGVEVE
jgi:hypothetical protein